MTGHDDSRLWPQEPDDYRLWPQEPDEGVGRSFEAGEREPSPTVAPPATRRAPEPVTVQGVRPVVALALALLAGAVGAVLSGGTAGNGGGGAERFGVIEQAGEAVLQIELEDGREGSAVLIGGDGYLISNSHVVGDATTVTIVDAQGERRNALVVGVDPTSDIALLRAGGNSSSGLQMRDLRREPLRAGETVLALGSPFGFSGSVTEGIISGTGRTLRMSPDELLTDLVQTDAAINPGNSGGPLIDLQGRIVGINTAIASTNGRSQGFGFAVPSDTVSRVVSDLLTVGYVRYARLGVLVGDLPETYGAVVTDVSEGGAAAAAGMLPGDLVIKAGGARVNGSEDLVAIVRGSEPGSRLPLLVQREGERIQLEVTLGEVAEPTS